MKKSSLVLLSMLCADTAFAEPPAGKAAEALVQKQVVEPLKKADAKRSKFSRAAPPPKARRVRVLDTVAQADARGKHFVRFAIDVRHRYSEDGEWALEAYLGCVYVDQRAVFLQQGSDYQTARAWLAGGDEVDSDACRPAPADAVQAAISAR